MTAQYTSSDVKTLTDFEHVRLRTSIYFGSMVDTQYEIPVFSPTEIKLTHVTIVPAAYKAVGEILDNSLDEFAHLPGRAHQLAVTANTTVGEYTITDNGRGIPIDMHDSGKPTPEVIFCQLRSGRNFTDERPKGVFGMNGVGSSCVVATSSAFDVQVCRDNKCYEQKFDNTGDASSPTVKRLTAAIKKQFGSDTGTKVHFKLDPTIFSSVSLPDEFVRNRMVELALCHPDLNLVYNGTKITMPGGFSGLLKKSSYDYAKFIIDTPKVSGEVFVIFNHPQAVATPKMFTWVNSSHLFDGGKCNAQFMNAFVEATIASTEARAKRAAKTTFVKSDIEYGLVVIANLQVVSPEFDSQNKTKLTGPSLRNEFDRSIADQIVTATKANKDWFDALVDRATRRLKNNSRVIVDGAFKRTTKHIEGLLDATSQNRSECRLLITEGKSAKSQISDARDPKTTAAYALTGKINNTHGMGADKVAQMGKLTDLLKAIGLVPGVSTANHPINYGKIIIASDADYDGDDITTLLVNMIYQFWPELFDPKKPTVYRLNAPNICLVKKQRRVHFSNRDDYEAVKHKYDNSWEVKYYKGLGSMTSADWEMVLRNDSTLIPIVDDGTLQDTLDLLFGKDSSARRDWLNE